MEDADQALAVLRELTRLGIRLSVDDYGTGFPRSLTSSACQ
jgi:EAL domain-containing protein (putative c-di-GMP-specific phosphodiesterase class I)